jgi:hypothetical protein
MNSDLFKKSSLIHSYPVLFYFQTWLTRACMIFSDRRDYIKGLIWDVTMYLLFFLFEKEKTYLITCTSEILPLFLLKGRRKKKDKANVRERERYSPLSRSLSRFERIKMKRNIENKKVAVVLFFCSLPVEYRRIVLIIIRIIRRWFC